MSEAIKSNVNSGDEFKKARDNYDRYSYARDNGHLKYLKKSQLCEDFFQGLQWEEKIRKALQNAGRPVMTINKTFSTINTVMGSQLQNRGDVTFRPSYEGNSQTAEALAKVYLQIMNNHSFDFMESSMFDDGIIRSRGFIDAGISFDRNMRGNVKLRLWNPDNVLIDPDAEHYDPDEWGEVFKTKWMTLGQIEATYGKKAKNKLKDRNASSFPMGYDSIDDGKNTFSQNPREMDLGFRPQDKIRFRVIERQFYERKNVPHFINAVTGDIRPVPPTWEPARIQYVQDLYGWDITVMPTNQIRWITTVDDLVLHDKYSPLKHFTIVPYFPYFRRGKTMGLVEHLVNSQEMLNKVASQELHVLNASANGGWKVKRDSLVNMDIDELEVKGSSTGLVLELENVDDAEKIQPNQVPTGLDRMTMKLEEFHKDISGVNDAQRGFVREDVAARAIQENKAAGTVNLAKPFDNLLMTRKILARNVLDMIQCYYTEERTMQITGNTVGSQTEQLTVNQITPEGDVVNDLTAGTYEVVVVQVPTRESYMESQFQEAMQMREQGVQIPDSAIIEVSNLGKKQEILEQINNNPQTELDQRKAQLEVAQLEAELADTQADTARKGEETQLAAARAEKTEVDAIKAASEVGEGGQGQDPAMEAEKAMSELELKKYMFDQEMELKRYVADQELELKKEEARQAILLKKAEANLRLKQQSEQKPAEKSNG